MDKQINTIRGMYMSKKDHNRRLSVRERRRKQLQQQRLTTILIVIGIALILIAIIVLPSIVSASNPVVDITPIQSRTFPNANDAAMGDPNAPVKIIEYADFQCPACQVFSMQVEPQLIEYHSMGLAIGQESADSAMAAYCAGDQNKFWEYHDILFTNQTGENVGAFSPKRLQALGETIGLDMKNFNDCLSSRKYQERINQDQTEGVKSGVKVTPSFVINGKIVEGALPFEEFSKEIEAALQAAGAK
jgi:protein-disulfide isomerase